jgi:hypothetical protein
MVWIKRNLLFVISIALGLLLTGYCAYLLHSCLNANAGVKEEYNSTLSNLQMIQQKSPFPSVENIQAAKADQDHVRLFLASFRKKFKSFPVPPVEDERGFNTYLKDSLVRFRAEATNAGVLLPEDCSFAFSGLKEKLTYPPGNIAPWMQQLEEISAILDVLYGAKINYLDDLQRVPVSSDDTGAGLQAASVTNQLGVVTPYKIIFRGFSTEIAAVMEGFARSSNCFIIKAIDVAPDKSVPSTVVQPFAQQPAVTYIRPRQNPYSLAQNHLRPGMGMPGMRPAPAPVAAAPVASISVAAASSPPVTILSEHPLLVTVSIDVVKLKASEH